MHLIIAVGTLGLVLCTGSILVSGDMRAAVICPGKFIR